MAVHHQAWLSGPLPPPIPQPRSAHRAGLGFGTHPLCHVGTAYRVLCLHACILGVSQPPWPWNPSKM